MKKPTSKQDEEFSRRLESSVWFFVQKKDYEKSLSELKIAGSLAISELNKKRKKEQEIEFERRNVKLPLLNDY